MNELVITPTIGKKSLYLPPITYHSKRGGIFCEGGSVSMISTPSFINWSAGWTYTTSIHFNRVRAICYTTSSEINCGIGGFEPTDKPFISKLTYGGNRTHYLPYIHKLVLDEGYAPSLIVCKTIVLLLN